MNKKSEYREGLWTVNFVYLTVIVLVWLSVASMACAAESIDTALTAKLDPSSELIVKSGQKAILRLRAPAGHKINVTAFPYLSDGTVAEDPWRRFSLNTVDTRSELGLSNFPPGLYLLKVQLDNGEEISTTLAVIPSPGAPIPTLGVNTHFGQNKGALPRSLELIQAAGFGWIRDEIPWRSVEKNRGSYVFPSFYDQYVNTAQKKGLSLLVVLDYGNPLYTSSQPGSASTIPSTDQQRLAFARYAKAVASRYKGQVKAYEIWNEPSPSSFGGSGWAGYTKLLSDVYPSIKMSDSSVDVIACGGGGTGGGPAGDCVDGVLRSGGQNAMDGYSIHPYMAPYDPDIGYPAKNSPAFKSVNVSTVSHSVMASANRRRDAKGKPLAAWVTEIGWFSLGSSERSNEATQAAYLARAFLENSRQHAFKTMFWYDFQNDGNDTKNPEHNFGLIRLDFSPKPSYIAAAIVCSQLRAATWDKVLVDDAKFKVYQYKKSDTFMLAAWTLTGMRQIVRIRLKNGKYREIDWQGRTRTLTVVDNMLEWEITANPRFLQPIN